MNRKLEIELPAGEFGYLPVVASATVENQSLYGLTIKLFQKDITEALPSKTREYVIEQLLSDNALREE